MLKLPSPIALQLRDGQLLRWQQAMPVTLRVMRGRVWVTRPGDPDDHFLDAGAALRLAAGGGVLIGAEGAAQIAIEAERSAWRLALRRWFQRASSSRARRASIAAAPASATGAASSMT
jgi:hypothetical protein